jgi:GLPGLI family protein
MKKVFLFFGMVAALAAGAQIKEGHVVYERTLQMPKGMVNDPNIAAQIPKSRTDHFELLFGNNQSLYQYLPKIDAEEPGTVSGGNFVIRMGGGSNDITFHDFNTGTRIDQLELFDKAFVVTDSIKKLSWKVGAETKTILGHTVQKATSRRIGVRPRMTMENGKMKREEFPDTASVVAWFAPDIPVPAGPDLQGQLPGLILELNIDNGQTTYQAVELSPKVNTGKIKAPKNGKKLTAAEFTKERARMTEEMAKNMPSGMQVRTF